MKESCYKGFLLLIIIVLSFQVHAQQDNICGPLKGAHFGPFDYLDRVQLKDKLDLVEAYHFAPEIEKLKAGTQRVAADLNYTLQAWPNHHRALASLAKLAIREKTTSIPGLKYNVECYFDRAFRWRSNDSTVRSIYGSYLSKVGRSSSAIEQLEIAVRIQPDNATAHYNLGLLYFDKGNHDKARFHAERAYEFDFPLPGLRNKLIRIGKWKK